MGVKHPARAMVLVASLVVLAEQTVAIELGELQAVPGTYAPYIFRLAIMPSPRAPAGTPAVIVHHPHDALSFVKNNILELRLGSLSDVELEISHGGQTLNRLLLISELQAARAQRWPLTVSPRHPPAMAKDRETPAAETKPLMPPASSAPDRALVEREMQGIRQEIQGLVKPVIPWEGLSTPAWHADPGTATWVFTLILGGLFIVGVTSLFTGYLMHRSAVDRERRLRWAQAAYVRRRAQGELTSGAPTPPVVRRRQLFERRHERVVPITMLRRVWVSQKIRRRIRVRTSHGTHDAPQQQAAVHTQVVARVSHARSSAPAEFVEALANMRRELIRLQRSLPPSTTPKQPLARRGPH
jgi:hypothetical protein